MSSLRDCSNVPCSRTSKCYFICMTIGLLIICSIHVGANCTNMEVVEKGEISCRVIKEILTTHNKLRESVSKGFVDNQPPASSLREFYWDEELAKGAQDWANQCTFAHNNHKDREVARFKVGQNIALTKSKRVVPPAEKEFSKQINNWFEEYKIFEFGPIRRLEDLSIIGHYTQIVWADTYLVGCGFSRYKTANNVTHRLYVCHYGPTGNKLGKQPYETEIQECPDGLIESKKYRKLCSLRKSPPNPCRAKHKRKNIKYVKKNPGHSKKPKYNIDGRKSYSPSFSLSTKKISPENFDNNEKGYNYEVTRRNDNIVPNVFFSFFVFI